MLSFTEQVISHVKKNKNSKDITIIVFNNISSSKELHSAGIKTCDITISPDSKNFLCGEQNSSKSKTNKIPLISNSVSGAILHNLKSIQSKKINIFLSELTRTLIHSSIIIGIDSFKSIQKSDFKEDWSCLQSFRENIENTYSWYFLSTLPIINKNDLMKENTYTVMYTAYSPSQPRILKSMPLNQPTYSNKKICISSISLGLPNEGKEFSVFDSNNVNRLFEGENFINKMHEEELDSLLRHSVVQIKKENGKRIPVPLSEREKIIKLAAKLGKFNLQEEFRVPKYMLEALDITCKLAMAAGLSALKSSNIPLSSNSKSSYILPTNMQDDTGIIFASSFPTLDSCVTIISNYYENLYKNRKNENYSFDRKLLFKILVLANSQLAELICAKGPNTFINAACASTSQALCIASDWIKIGRCKRVIVISADNASSSNMMQYVGNGFLALGAASIKSEVKEAAVPFNINRSGIIIGMAAAGFILESTKDCINRGGTPLTEIISTHFANSAFNGVSLDKNHLSNQLEKFIQNFEDNYSVSREYLSKKLLYFSHETGTKSTGGCAKAECDSLFQVFKNNVKNIIICSIKGFIGHPMGVGVEDIMSVASLIYNKIPPIANYDNIDPCLGPIHLSPGGKHHRKYALRLAAGFGSQIVFVLFKKYEENKCSLV